MSKKIGSDFAKEQFRKGLHELRELGHFQGSNIAQPNQPTLDGDRGSGQPEVKPNRGPEIEHEL